MVSTKIERLIINFFNTIFIFKGYGARPIRRWIEKNVVTRLVEIMLAGEEEDAITDVSIDVAEEANALKYNVSKSRKSRALNS